jgi:AraC-like DNA-binding protein
MTLYREHRAPARLRPWVRCFWELRAERGPGEPARVERVLPDGCLEWIFHLGEPFALAAASGAHERQAAALLAGASTRAVLLVPSQRADVLGVRFEPGGAAPFVRPPAFSFAERIVPLAEAEDGALVELEERLREASVPARIGVLERFLLERAAGLADEGRLAAAVRVLLAPRASVDAAARAASVGVRQLERRFRDEVGLAPKELAGVARLRRAAQLLEGRLALADVAAAAGYADQAHLGREFRALAGISPGRYRRESHALAAAFAAGT